jgi:hypothetical protein
MRSLVWRFWVHCATVLTYRDLGPCFRLVL